MSKLGALVGIVMLSAVGCSGPYQVTCTRSPFYCYEKAEEICGPRWQQFDFDFNSTPNVYRMKIRCWP